MFLQIIIQYYTTYQAKKKGCGESIKEFLTLGFWGSVLGVSVFVTSKDLINRGYKTECVFRGKTDA